MTREEFYTDTLRALKKRLSDRFAKEYITMEKQRFNDGREGMILRIGSPENNCVPVFNLDRYYEEYLIGCSAEEVLDRIERDVRDHADFMEETNYLKMDKYEDIRSLIRVRLVSDRNIPKRAERCAVKRFPYFGAMLYAWFRSDKGYSALVPVAKEDLEKWGRSEDEVFAEAIKRMSLEDIILAPLKEEARGPQNRINYWTGPADKEKIREAGILVFTVFSRHDGSALLLRDEALHRIYQLLGSNYYILPSSIHEVMILADIYDYDHERISGYIREVNETALREEDVLLDEALYYDGGTSRLLLAREYVEERKQKLCQAQSRMIEENLGGVSA